MDTDFLDRHRSSRQFRVDSFRANSLSQSSRMWLAVLSPSSYSSYFMSSNLYLLVAAVGGGYLLVLLVTELLDSWSVGVEASAHPYIARIARWRWYWIPALYLLALLTVSIVTITQSASTSQFMYSNF